MSSQPPDRSRIAVRCLESPRRGIPAKWWCPASSQGCWHPPMATASSRLGRAEAFTGLDTPPCRRPTEGRTAPSLQQPIDSLRASAAVIRASASACPDCRVRPPPLRAPARFGWRDAECCLVIPAAQGEEMAAVSMGADGGFSRRARAGRSDSRAATAMPVIRTASPCPRVAPAGGGAGRWKHRYEGSRCPVAAAGDVGCRSDQGDRSS